MELKSESSDLHDVLILHHVSSVVEYINHFEYPFLELMLHQAEKQKRMISQVNYSINLQMDALHAKMLVLDYQ